MTVATPARLREHSGRTAPIADGLAAARSAQTAWAQLALAKRLRRLLAFRHLLAAEGERLARLIPDELPRTQADTLSAEILPLAEAVRFLELEAGRILSVRAPGNRSRPSWLRGVQVQVQRDPWGVVLVIGPSNYTLFLPAVQTLQALAAGNAVYWKPGAGGGEVARAVVEMLVRAGVPQALVTVTDESAEAAQELIACGVDKIVMTGSEASGRAVLRAAAEKLTPATVELSGCDAMFVLKDADLPRSVDALLFGLRFNGSSTCIAPRRVFLQDSVAGKFSELLCAKLGTVPAVVVNARTAALVDQLRCDAVSRGAIPLAPSVTFADRNRAGTMSPLLLDNATPAMQVMRTDVFAPIAGLCRFESEEQALTMANQCPYALGATVFGASEKARAFGQRVQSGIVVVNDMIAPTADPRIAFGGRRGSGFGKSRGEEGLLEMTVSKTVAVQTAKRLRHLEAPHPLARQIFAGFLQCAHGRGAGFRARSLWALGKTLIKKSDSSHS